MPRDCVMQNNAVIMRVFGDRFQMAAYWGDVPESGGFESNQLSD